MAINRSPASSPARFANALFLLLFAAGASAGPGHPWITVEPAQPLAGESIRLRIDVPQSVPYVPPVVQIDGQVVRVQVVTPDFGGPQFPARTEFFVLGALPVGSYRFEYYDCVGLPPPPVPACSFAGSEEVVVSARGVPSMGAGALLALASLLALSGARACRPRGIRA